MFYCLRNTDAECRRSKFSVWKFELRSKLSCTYTHTLLFMAWKVLCFAFNYFYQTPMSSCLSFWADSMPLISTYIHIVFWLFVEILNRILPIDNFTVHNELPERLHTYIYAYIYIYHICCHIIMYDSRIPYIL